MTEEQKKARKVEIKGWCCWHWNKHGKCPKEDKCNFSHDPETWKIDQAHQERMDKFMAKKEAKVSARTIRIMAKNVTMGGPQINKAQVIDGGPNMGLLDSGASEVVRPYIRQWWDDIISGKQKGRRVNVILAGGSVCEAVLTGKG